MKSARILGLEIRALRYTRSGMYIYIYIYTSHSCNATHFVACIICRNLEAWLLNTIRIKRCGMYVEATSPPLSDMQVLVVDPLATTNAVANEYNRSYQRRRSMEVR